MDPREKTFLVEMMPIKEFDTVLKYRGSRDGWMNRDFHYRCDNLGPTLTLFKLLSGDCIGGFTSAQWSSPDKPIYREDSTAMLFNLTQRRCYKIYAKSSSAAVAIKCHKDIGPYFGDCDDTIAELKAMEPYDKMGCYSRTAGNVFQISADYRTGLNELTGMTWIGYEKYEKNICFCCCPPDWKKFAISRIKYSFFQISEIEVWEVVHR